MALIDTPWCGDAGDKLYLQSGRFSSTLKTSQSVNSIDITVNDISWDGANTPWAGNAANKLYLQSAQFTSTLKTSESVGGVDSRLMGISWDGTNTPWAGDADLKLYLQSGQFTSTLKTSEDMTAIDTEITGVSSDTVNSPWCGFKAHKLYLQSGRYTSTMKTSQTISAFDTRISGITFTGVDTPWCGFASDKLYLQSGQFTSTLKTSEDISGIDTSIQGIEVNDFDSRIAPESDTASLSVLTLALAVEAPSITGTTENVAVAALSMALTVGAPTVVIPISDSFAAGALALGLVQEGASITAGANVTIGTSVLTMSLSQGAVTITGDAILFAPDVSMIIIEASLGLHAITVEIADSVRNVVTNTRNFAISEYGNFPFNSMCQFNGKYLFAKADGIYEGGGTTDDGSNVDASYKTGVNNIYGTEIQRLRDAYLNFRSNGDIQLFSVGEELNSRQYNITNSASGTIHERRVKFEKGIKERNFNFGVSNINGSSFEIKSAKVLTEPIRKRR